jgi:hypothetical protein
MSLALRQAAHLLGERQQLARGVFGQEVSEQRL